ncbi:MAG TPA: hypothetical protein DCY51_00215 [Bacteroidetes bacterium]|nr:hypothetical protein [Bacteroidota bacterium]
MKRQLLTLLTVAFIAMTYAQFEHQRVYSTFDNLPLAKADTFNNGADSSVGFTHYGRYWNNSYNPTWGSWSGWALSNMTDTLTAGFGNQYSAITGQGVSSTANYMVSTGSRAYIKLDEATAISGAYFTNTTYTARDMEQGSGFSKKFGGDDGNDEDFFRVVISSYLAGTFVDSTIFYLADYRFADNSKDYIVKDWTFVDFNNDPSDDIEIDSISFRYEGSDNGEFGLNTPAYFCMDDFNAISDYKVFGNQFRMGADTFFNGSDAAGGFLLDQMFFPNSYNSDWNSWSGWSISTMYDTVTAGFTNQYSSKMMPLATLPTSNDVVHQQCFISGGVSNEIRGPYLAGQEPTIFTLWEPPVPVSLFITNTTYAFKDMKNGSGFSKKFGGASGDDPDYFRLLVHSISIDSDTLLTDTIYLADFRFEDNTKDYILEEWKEAKIDYSHKIGFELQSSDNGMFGMNTPAYFSLSLIQRLPVSISEVKKEVEVMAYPNPTSDLLHFVSQNSIENISILSLQGEKVQNYIVDNKSAVLNIENLPSGIYLARVYTEEGIATKRFIKQ